MNKELHKGLRIILLLTILSVNLGLDHAQMVYAAAPTHDNFANAKLINSITYTDLNVNTTEATPRYNPVETPGPLQLVTPGDGADPAPVNGVGPCEANQFFNTLSGTVWYTYTPLQTESISVDTIGSLTVDGQDAYDTFIAVWTGSPPNLSLEGCNDDDYGGDAVVSFIANAGTTYHIQVGEFNGYYDATDPVPGSNEGGILQFHAYITNIDVTIGSNVEGRYYMESGDSTVESYISVKGGPVVVKNINGDKIIASTAQLRRSDNTVNQWTGLAQIMGVPEEQLSDTYVFPYYSSTDLTKYEVINIANYDAVDRNVTVKVGSTTYGPYLVGAGQFYIFNQPIAGSGPVVVSSVAGAKIIVSLYQLKRAGTSGRWNGQSEMMGVPLTKLSSTYVLPYYDYTTPGLAPSLVFANAGNAATSVTVTIGATTYGPYNLAIGQSMIQSYSGVKGGPVVIKGTPGTKIVASTVQLRRSDITVNQWTGLTQIMGVPEEQLSDTYVFPYYSSTDPTKYEVINIANYDAVDRNVTVKVGSTTYGPFLVGVGQFYIFNQPIAGDGPVVVSSVAGAKIIASLYQLKRAGTSGRWNGQSEMMGVPLTKLSSTYVLPYYDYTTPGLAPSLVFAAP